jgi:hypothetical protein
VIGRPLDGDPGSVAGSDLERAQNIYSLLAARARGKSQQRLAIDAALGAVALATAPFLPTLWWVLACPIVIVGAYGLWGLADRRLMSDPPPAALGRHSLEVVKRAAILFGTAAAVMAILGFMVAALGEWHH